MLRDEAVVGPPHRLDSDIGNQILYRALPLLPVEPAGTAERDHTPNHQIKRYCNGCSLQLGNATGLEADAAAAGALLPDVRNECPVCAPALTVQRHTQQGKKGAEL